jgi:hypothetical protein
MPPSPGRPRKITPDILRQLIDIRSRPSPPQWRELEEGYGIDRGTLKNAYSKWKRSQGGVVK